MVDIKEIAKVTKGGAVWGEKTCFLCGEHFKASDEIAIIVVYGIRWDICKQYKRLRSNQVAHKKELEDICNRCETIEEVYEILGNSKEPSKEKMNEQQKQRVETFIRAAYDCGYRNSNITKEGCTCKMNGYTDTIKYNVFSDRIRYSNRRKRQMFDGLFERQTVANIYNKFHELLGDGKIDNYSATDTFNKITDSVKTTMKDMGF